jgi:hypothetical protein
MEKVKKCHLSGILSYMFNSQLFLLLQQVPEKEHFVKLATVPMVSGLFYLIAHFTENTATLVSMATGVLLTCSIIIMCAKFTQNGAIILSDTLANCHCCSLQMFAGDSLPAQVCHQCIQQVNSSYNFKLQCESSDIALRQYLRSLDSQSNSYQVTDRHTCKSELSIQDDLRGIIIIIIIIYILHSVHYNSVITVQTNECTQFY